MSQILKQSAQEFLDTEMNGKKRMDDLFATASGVSFDSFKDAFNFSLTELQTAANQGNIEAQILYLLHKVWLKKEQTPTVKDLKDALKRWGKIQLLRDFGLE